MQARVQTEPPERITADWLVVGAFQNEDGPLPGGSLGKALAPVLTQLRAGADFEGKPNELLPIYGIEGIAAARVLFVGLGKVEDFARRRLLQAASTAARAIAKKQRERVVFSLLGDGVEGISTRDRVADIVTGALLGATGQDLYREEKARTPFQELVVACEPDADEIARTALARGEIIGRAVNQAREWVNTPAAEIFPESFCARVQKLADAQDLGIEILGPEELARQGMNCILGVGGGSRRPPQLLVLRYRRGGSEGAKTLALVGKGITFDSGGLSLKSAEHMGDMKCDMAGAATVVAAASAIAQLKVPVNLLCLAPLAENMPGGSALRPGDVLRAKNGKTIEVVNTDAEGRLVLADALCHAVDLGADHIVDLATLTGACMVALGPTVAGVMTNDKPWGDRLCAAAEQTGERLWPLPMFDDYDEPIRSDVADMKNSGGRWGGAITAAKLLANFVGDVPWAHVDIAGPAYAERDATHQDGGGTGYFVRTLVELAEQYGQPR